MGKTYIDDNGYLRFKDSDKLLHHWVAENMIGRRLKSREVVHHKNNNKRDNRPENLNVINEAKEHKNFHETNAETYANKSSYIVFKRKT